MTARTWRRGEVVALRELWNGRIWKARPCFVVHDRPDQIALYVPYGAPMKLPPGSGIPRSEWELIDAPMHANVLRLATPGAAHSVLLFWDTDGTFDSWRVNLERPLRRTQVGFDYLDQELDIRVCRDRSWELLDEDDFDEARRRGVIDDEAAEEVLAEARRAIDRIERWESPFRDGWERWRPDPEWGVPDLPCGWDRIEAAAPVD